MIHEKRYGGPYYHILDATSDLPANMINTHKRLHNGFNRKVTSVERAVKAKKPFKEIEKKHNKAIEAWSALAKQSNDIPFPSAGVSRVRDHNFEALQQLDKVSPKDLQTSW